MKEEQFIIYRPDSTQKIWKYALYPGENTFDMPGLVKPLAVGWQGQQLFMWCIVRPAYPSAAQVFTVAMTGQTLPGKLGDYIGSAMGEIPIVAHVFRRF
jgi:hypothetical protein